MIEGTGRHRNGIADNSKISRLLGRGIVLCCMGWFLLGSSLGKAQPIYEWSGKQITLGWNKPIFSEELEYDPVTSAALMDFQWPLGGRQFIRGTLPWIYYRRPENRASLLGNPSIEWQKKSTGPLDYRFDLVFPVVRDTTGEATFVGSRIHYPTRERYFHKAWTFGGGITFERTIYQHWLIRLYGDLEATVFDQFRQADFYTDYQLELSREQQKIHYDVSWQGSFLLAGNSGTPGDEWGHLIQLGFGYQTALVDPRLQFSIPLTPDLARDVNYVMGVSLTVDMDKLRWPGYY